MKTRSFLLTLLLGLSLCASAQLASLPDSARFDAPVSLRTSPAGESLRDIILALAGSVGLTAVVDDVPDAIVTYNIADGKPFRQVWNLVLTLNDLDYALLENDLVVVGTPAAVTRLRDPATPVANLDVPVVQRFFRIEGDIATTRDFLQQEIPLLSINVLEGSNLLSIRGTQAQQDEVAAILEQIDQPGVAVTLEQRLYRLSNARAEDLAAVLQAASSTLLQTTTAEDGTTTTNQASDFVVVADPRTNSLLVTAPVAVQRRVAELLPQLDAPQQQVNVQVRIQEIQSTAARNLGINLNAGLGSFAATVLGGGLNFIFNPQSVLTGLNLGATLDTLESQGLSRRVDDTNLTTLNNQPARLNSGGRIEITLPGVDGTANERTLEFGVIIQVTPRISADGRVILEVQAEVSDIATALGTGIPQRIDFTTREVSSTVSLEPGQTVVLGGLLQNSFSDNVSRVPILGSLPLIGDLFTTRTIEENNTELLLVIHAFIVE